MQKINIKLIATAEINFNGYSGVVYSNSSNANVISSIKRELLTTGSIKD